jgi:hypothetical protein
MEPGETNEEFRREHLGQASRHNRRATRRIMISEGIEPELPTACGNSCKPAQSRRAERDRNVRCLVGGSSAHLTSWCTGA